LSIIVFYSITSLALSQENDWSYSSYQLTDEHRYVTGAATPGWGHHLGHMVRTADNQLWYVDDTGNDVYHNPAANIHRFTGDGWDHFATIQNPNTIQQMVTTLAVGDTVYIYGWNTFSWDLEESKLDAVSGEVIPYQSVVHGSPGTNYLGAAVAPNGTRVVWWTGVVNNDGPGPWYYSYHDSEGWHDPIESWVPANAFSYNFVSFEDDSTFWVGGELPGGMPPNWSFKMGAGRVRLGQPLEEIVEYTDDLLAHSIWVNPVDKGVHLFGQSFMGTVSYYYRPHDGPWPEEGVPLPIGTVYRFRTVDSDDGNLYLVYNSNGFNMVPLLKSSISGALDLSSFEVVDIGRVIGFENTSAIWAETRAYQTNNIPGLAFAFHGNIWEDSGLLRSLHVLPGAGQPLKILLPNGQETLAGDEVETISWTFDPAANIDEVTIEWRAGSDPWQTVETQATNDGYFDWNTPERNGSDFELRIYDSSNPEIADTSDRPFSMTWEYVPEGPPVATILSPTGDVSLEVGETLTATGEATDIDGYVVRHEWDMDNGTVRSGISLTTVTYAWDTDGYYSLKYRAKDDAGLWGEADSVLVTVGDPTSINSGTNSKNMPETIEMHRAWPNPFNPNISIEVRLPSSQSAQIEVLDLSGRTVYDTSLTAGVSGRTAIFQWNGYNNVGQTVDSGTYIVRVSQDHLTELVKVTLLR
jgi:hypothetical protein